MTTEKMNSENEYEYDEKNDLGVTIDERLQVGKTAANIYLARATANVLAKLLIDKGIITAAEFVEGIRAKETEMKEIISSAKAENPDSTPKELIDIERFSETITEGFDTICEKATQ